MTPLRDCRKKASHRATRNHPRQGAEAVELDDALNVEAYFVNSRLYNSLREAVFSSTGRFAELATKEGALSSQSDCSGLIGVKGYVFFVAGVAYFGVFIIEI